MKRHLYAKFLTGYVVFGLLGFIFIAVFSSRLTENYLVRTSGEDIYTEAYLLAEICTSAYNGSDVNLETVSPRIESVTSYIGGCTWLMTRQGTIVYSTDESDTGHEIVSFDPSIMGQNHYITGDFYGYFSEEILTAYAPVSANYQTYGYVLIHLPRSAAVSEADSILNLVYLTSLVIFMLSLIVLLVFHFSVSRPLKKITEAANHFAEGDLSYRCQLRSEDEMGYLSDTLNDMAEDLSKTEESQRRFISNVSHDFRSPLTSIKGYLEAMIDGTIPPELYEKYMKRVISETERLTTLTQNTLSLENLEGHEIHLDMTDFDINQVIKDTVESFEGACHERKISFDLIFSERSLIVRADLSSIQQVLYNLIDNAIKFSHSDSVIQLETSERYDKVFVSVRDSGVGIPKANLKKIWDRFYKTDPSRGRDKKGTGLGLSIVKEIIQAHGQTIDVISTVGVGTEFIFTLSRGGQRG